MNYHVPERITAKPGDRWSLIAAGLACTTAWTSDLLETVTTPGKVEAEFRDLIDPLRPATEEQLVDAGFIDEP